jgi:transcriptional regulator with XRE-family HTH domain
MSFGDILRSERNKKGISQEELGTLINKSKNNISQYELGKREPDIGTLKMFAQIFKCSIDYLLDYSSQGIIQVLSKDKDPQYNINISDLPEEAVKQIRDLVEVIRFKYTNSK